MDRKPSDYLFMIWIILFIASIVVLVIYTMKPKDPSGLMYVELKNLGSNLAGLAGSFLSLYLVVALVGLEVNWYIKNTY